LSDQSREAEAAFLSWAMQYPYEAYVAAADHDLSDEDFAYIEHRRLFVAVMVSAEVSIRRWSSDFFVAWNRSEGYLFGDLIAEVGEFWLGPHSPGSIDDCAFHVKQLSERRQAASDAVRKLADAYGVERAGNVVERIIADSVQPKSACRNIGQTSGKATSSPPRKFQKRSPVRRLTERKVTVG